MKIQLDTINKTITIEEDVNLHDFYEQINTILPDGKWREFTLKVDKISKITNPITVTPHTPINPYRPLTTPQPNPYDLPRPQIWYTTNTGDIELNKGVFNITTKA